MKPDENEVQIRNAELNLASIREDTNKEAAILTSLLEGKTQVLKDIAEAKASLVKEREAIKEERAVLASERVDAIRIKQDSEGAVVRAKEEIKVFVQQKNEAMKELSYANDWIMKAEDSKRVLEAAIKHLSEEEDFRRTALEDISVLLERKKEAEEALRDVQIETSLLLDETKNKVAGLEKEAKLAVEARIEAQEASEKAYTELLDFHNERARLKKDLDVYVDRIEEKFGEAFPGLRMVI